MPLIRLRRFWKQGILRFEKFGELDYALHSLPQKRTLLVDVDSPATVRHIPDLFALARVIGLHIQATCYARTRRGWHLAIICKESFTELERVCLQSIFGDDEYRAALNFMRHWQSKGKRIPKFWRERSNILYRRKVQ